MTWTEPPYWWRPSRPQAAHVTRVLTVPPAVEPLTLAEVKGRAGLDWVVGDSRDPMLLDFLAAARSKVEKDSGYALLTQTWALYFDALPGGVIPLPLRPLQSVTSLKSTDAAGVVTTVDPASYLVDSDGRIGLTSGAVWPSDGRSFRPFELIVVAGWTTAELLKKAHPLLVHAVGLLTAHYATAGRDLATVGTIVSTTPQGYDDAMSSYLPVSLV